MSGHRILPLSATHFYSAAKFAVTALTEGMRQELREMKSSIKVTVSLMHEQNLIAKLVCLYVIVKCAHDVIVFAMPSKMHIAMA